MPVATVVGRVRSGMAIEEVAKEYTVEIEDVQAALDYAEGKTPEELERAHMSSTIRRLQELFIGVHKSEIVSQLVPHEIRPLHVLFDRFRHNLDSALDRANEEFSQHMPSKGDVCEAAVRKYLTETLGTRYAVTHGVIFDSSGSESREQDVIIFDDHWSMRLTPRDSGEPAILPVETVYATIEVKKTLSASSLRDAIDNIRSFKSLKRERVGPEYVTPNKGIVNLRGPGTTDVRNPYFAAVFAFTANRSMEAIVEQLKQEVSTIPPEEWPDVVAVHKEGVILPYCTTCQASGASINSVTGDNHNPSYLLDRFDGAYSLLGFHLLLAHHLHFTILSGPDLFRMYGNLAYVVRTISALESYNHEDQD